MHIAVSGGSGNFARVLIRHLHARGHTVRSIDQPGREAPSGVCERRALDLRNSAVVEDALRGCDGVAHLAAIPGLGLGVADEEVYANNTAISYNVLCAVGELGIEHVVLASSVNAIGGAFGHKTAYRAFPVDESQPCFAEDAYSLSKWVMEQQADATARRFPGMTIASLCFHALPEADPPPEDVTDAPDAPVIRTLWGYTRTESAARAVELALRADFIGHQVFFIAAPRTIRATPSLTLAQRYYPHVPIICDLPGNAGFYDCSKAERLFGWRHDA
jgi:UDP-glucose 4-epimerase